LSRKVEAGTVFDLASVTKALATTSACMLLFEEGKLELESPVASVLPEFRGDDPRRLAITFRMLLAHSSGLPAYVRLFETAKTRQELLSQASKVPLIADPGSTAEYSDVGFILLGEALERITGQPLHLFCGNRIFTPLGLEHTGFNPARWERSTIPPTENDRRFRHKLIRAAVNDENAWVMGGVAGHAGCFGPAQELAIFAECVLRGGSPLFDLHTVELFTRREPSPAGTSRTLGWDTPSHPSQSGKYFSPRAYGHLGYTGTSLWIDPERQLSVTLLTNRTWPDRSSQIIRQIRPAFHDAVVEALR
jgi:CubicO group peptidase (beta-lactamase class C family)